MKTQTLIAVILGSLAFATGCTTTIDRNIYDSTFVVPEKSFQQNSASIAIMQKMEPTGVITLDDALKAALEKHPGLAASRHEIKASEGAARQAGMLSNPSLSGEIEEFGGSRDYSGTDFMASKIVCMEASVERSLSVSSILRTNLPPILRAKSQLKRAVRAPPM